jgi:hypothetical protein
LTPSVQPSWEKYSAFPVGQIISTSSSRPASSQKGRLAIVTKRGAGCGGRLRCSRTKGACGGRRSRVVLTPRRWRQVGDNACALRLRRWQTSPVTGESAKETVKTIARGMPGGSGVTVVTTLVCFFISHARLRARHAPGIPCALCLQRAEGLKQNSRGGAARSRRCGLKLAV